MTPRSKFFAFATESFVMVEDENQGMSVTNDAEAVVEHLGRTFDLSNMRVLYRDTDGRWDEMVIKDGRFAGFKAVGTTGSWEEAIRVASRPGR